MNTKVNFPPVLFLLIPMLILAGCSNPSSRSKITPTINITQARQTVEARLTQVAGTPLATSTPAGSSTPATTSTVNPLAPTSQASPLSPTPTVAQPTSGAPAPTSVAPTADSTCDLAAPGYPSIDVTIDDDTVILPGKTFTKIWRLTNEGSCTWTNDYAAVWFSGEKLGGTTTVPLGRNVLPGESIEISVDMVASMNAGTYQSNWKLRNAGGVLFGIGPTGDAPFWVRIVVAQTETGTLTPVVTPSLTPTGTTGPTSAPTSTPTVELTLTPTPTTAPPIQVYGSATLLPGEAIDLDTTQKNTGANDDLSYIENGSYHLITPLSNTVLGVYGSVQPTLEDCQSASMSTAPIAVESLSAGAFLCYRTGQQLPGWMQLKSFSGDDYSINFEFLTWAAP